MPAVKATTRPSSAVGNMSDCRSRGREFHTLVAILLPSADSRRVVVSYKQKYGKLAQEKRVVR